MRISKYLDELQKAVGAENDKELAVVMGWSHSVPSHYRTGKRFMDNQIAGIVSSQINKPVIEIIAAVEADREEKTGQKSFWTDFFLRTASAAAVLCVTVTLFLTPSPAEAAPVLTYSAISQDTTLYYVKSIMHRLGRKLRNALDTLLGIFSATTAAAA